MIEALLLPMMLLINFIIPIQVLCAVAAIIISFYNPPVAYIVTGSPLLILVLTWLWGKAIPIPEPIPELSPLANELRKRFRAFFVSPMAGRNCSGAASGIMLSLIPITIVSCSKGFWWGIAIGASVFLLVAPLQRVFTPTHFLNDEEQVAFDELMEHMNK